MTNSRSLSLRSLAIALFATTALLLPASIFAQTPRLPAPSVARITAPIDESNLVTLKGNTLASANAKNDQGPVSPDLRMTDLILVLSRAPQQQAAFDAFVNSQYDQNSPNFHQWLTPQQIGAQYGPAPSDIATITGWLASHGFTVNEVSPDGMSIRFSGNATQVQGTFHTQIHNLLVNGKPHIANMSDPQIPAALASVVVGVKALHNFFPKPLHRMGGTVQRDAASGKWQRLTTPAASGAATTPAALANKPITAAKPAAATPQFGISGTENGYPYLVEDVDPWDFATIYNILPLWNAGTPIDGTGQKIAIAGTSDIDVGQSSTSETGANGNNDVLTFRNYFGLPTNNAANTPIRISGNSQPLTVCTDTTGNVPYPTNPCGIGDLTENSLDVEWSGSVAKNAQIILVSSYPASVTDDNLYDSESYIVNHLTAPIMNVSYGECELANGTAGNVEYYDLWQQAAAEGISVFVAAGDSGSDSCDDGNPYSPVVESGLSVSGLASTPWNTAVGGTDFNWCSPDKADGTATNTECTASPYWSTTPITSQGSTVAVTSALGYVPETPWNETCANPLTLSWVQDIADYLYGFTASQISTPEQACNFLLDGDFYGNAYEGFGLLYYDPYITYLLQAVGGSGGASGCIVGTAVENSSTGALSGCTATSGAGSTGTTTSPDTGASQASLATYNNGWPKPSWQTGVSGIPADGVRDIPDVSFFASDGYVSSSAYLICVSQVNSGSTPCTYSSYSEPFYQEVGGTSVATPAMAGVMALVNQKTGVSQGFANPELYSLASKQSYGSCSAESVTAGGTCMFNDIDTGNNAAPCDEGIFITTYDSPNCSATQSTLSYPDNVGGLGISTGYNAGAGFDLATGLGSLNIANVVNNWVSDIGTGATTVTVSPASGTVSLGTSLNVTVTVAKNPSGTPTPTGNVTLSGGGYTSSPEPLSSGSYMFTIPAGALAGGSVTLTANYSGDANYAPNSNTAIVTVTKLTATVNVPAPASLGTIESNQLLVVTGTVTGTGATPTGTVTVSYGTTYTSSPATLNSSGQYSVTITPNSIPGGTPSQVDNLSVNYSGDSNYNAASNTTSVIVKFFQVLTPTLTISPAATTVNSGSSLLVTVAVAGPVATPANPTPTGSVTLSGGGFPATTWALGGASCSTPTPGVACFTIPANTLSINPGFAVTDTLTAAYLGDPNYAQVTGTKALTVSQSVFSVGGTGPSSPVAPGTSASASVAVSSATNYTGTVTLTSASCVLTGYSNGASSSNPDNPKCTLSGNGTVTLVNGVPTGSPVNFDIQTYSATSLSSELRRPVIGPGSSSTQLAKLSTPANPHAPHAGDKGWFGAAGGAAFAALFLFLIPGGARKWSRMLGMILFVLAVTFAIEGCGGSGSGGGTTVPTLPTPTVTVTPPATAPTFNAAFNVTVTVAGSAGTPTGGVTLSGGALAGIDQQLSGGSTTFTIPANTFAGGASVTLTATYQGSSAYNSASGTAPLTVDYVPTTAGTYTFTVTPTSSPSIATSTTFTVTVN